MKILLVEDDKKKADEVSDLVSASVLDYGVSIVPVSSLADATREIYESAFDLVILDLCLPLRPGSDPVDVSNDILGVLKDSEKNCLAPAIALTQFDDLLETQIAEFARAGITVVHYDPTGNWRASLEIELKKVSNRRSLDFVIISALEKERSALREAGFTFLDPCSVQGLDGISVKLGEYNGAAIKLNRMGLVECGITTARALDTFRPRIVAMSGICAGFEGEVNPGDLVIPSICWEYQTGKLTDEGFKMEPYSVELHERVSKCLATMLAADPNAKALKSNIPVQEIIDGTVHLAPTTSGSAVVASAEAMDQIGNQHRKVAALEMELFALYRACKTSVHCPVFFGAKTVVDLGNASKNDHLHLAGSLLSARCVASVIGQLLD